MCLGFVQARANTSIPADICEMRSEDFLAKSFQEENLTRVHNNPGAFKTGLCWWHSRMQRHALYLAIFDQPTSRKPNRGEAYKLLERIAKGTEVVSVPGFKNWQEFTGANEGVLLSFLSRWELEDTAMFQFARGLVAENGTSTQTYQQIFQQVNEYKRITYAIVKFPRRGVAHSWLINSFQPNAGKIQNKEIVNQGFKMTMIDSNAPLLPWEYDSKMNRYKIAFETITWDYANGNKEILGHDIDEFDFPDKERMVYPSGETLTLYVQHDTLDFLKYTYAIRKHCGRETPFTKFEKSVQGKTLGTNLKNLIGINF